MEKRNPIMPTIVLFLVLAALFPAESSGKGVRTFLPVPGFAEGWVIDGKIITYTEENLYRHINGEAELYYPYGFRTLATAFYITTHPSRGALAADIYEMGSLLDAFGIYSRYRDPDGDIVHIGAEGFVNESQLLFYKDRYFVRLSASGDTSPDRSAFITCAKAIAGRIPGTSSPPEMVTLLNIPALVPRTETYVAQNVLGYAFFKRGLTAEAQVDGETGRIFVIPCETTPAAKRTFDEYKVYLEKAGPHVGVREERRGSTLVAHDPLYKGVAVRQIENFLIGVTKLTDPSTGASLLDALENRIRSR